MTSPPTLRRGRVLNHGRLAGVIEEIDGGYRFTYDSTYLASAMGPIGLTFPKRAKAYTSPTLFPFFFGLLAEGSTLAVQRRVLHLDETDLFGLLLATGGETVGSVTIEMTA